MAKNSNSVQKKADDKRAGTRTRNWTFIVYPESAPSDWEKILESEQVSFVVSPLHDSDISDNETGELKKAHYHVIMTFSSVKTYEQVKELTDKLNAPIPQKVNSMVGAVRYLTHLDHADKFQYDKADIRCFNGFDLDKYLIVTATDRYQGIMDMIDFVTKEDITEFSELLTYSRINNHEWFKMLCDNSAYVLTQFIKSRRHQSVEQREKEKTKYYGEKQEG